ncbi:GGDEF domain-containing protein [Devosia epidermidihirudinis]|uniref:GGDEF domain-containing protein n=1 Tax=Devosia epidermidihirudinis TaxID=1293439 RepID=UPI000698C138|nr:GGDEF domain-containing protein [Devosia epidermidihirudinis]
MATPTPSHSDFDLHTIYQNLPIALCLVGREGQLLVVNSIHAKLAGREAEELIGARVADLHPQGGLNVIRDFEAFDHGRTVPDHELEIRGRLYLVSTSPVLNASGEVMAISVAHIDITEKKAAQLETYRINRALEELSIRDHLTGAFNRREFDRLIKQFSKGTRNDQDFSLIMFDVDLFKSFNDLYGHQAGDDCLRSVAKAVKRSLRQAESALCRYGGEEFAILIKHPDPKVALKIAQRITRAVQRMAITHSSGVEGVVTISCGVATSQRSDMLRPAELPAQLIGQADAALYAAKEAGRNTVRSFPVE